MKADAACARDYGLLGRDGRAAVANGLASAQWYATKLPRNRLRALMRRSDGPALRDTALWFAALVVSGGAGCVLWGSWWAVPAFATYGVLYGSASDSRWHECGHGTAFRTGWMNDALYQIASFMVLREATCWRWSHARHHTDTIIVGRDTEIGVPRPPNVWHLALAFFALRHGLLELRKVAIHATGRLTAEDRTYIPASATGQVAREARIWIAVHAGVVALAVGLHSWLPLMLVGLPSFYGAWLYVLFGFTQHAGLAEDVLDHRLNSRTVYMNRVSRFLYWNMNYHVEHHMFPMVPYHALPALHEAMRHDCPPAYRGLWSAWAEIIPALIHQRREPDWCVPRPLPNGIAMVERVPVRKE